MYNNVRKAFHFLYGDIALNIFFSGEGGWGETTEMPIYLHCVFFLSEF